MCPSAEAANGITMLLDQHRRETIAVFSVWALPAMIILLGFVLTLVYFWIDVATGHQGLFKDGLYGTFALVNGSLIVLLSWSIIWQGFRQVFCDGRRAIWTEEGCLICLGPDYLKIPCSDISRISFGYNNRNQEGLEILLADGSKKFLLTGGLTTSAEAIEKRLKELCLSAET